MERIDSRTRQWLVWLMPFAAVALMLGWETDWGNGLQPEARAADAPVKPQAVSVALLPDFKVEGGTEARRETVDRTLFNPTRRPAPPAPATAGTPSSMARGSFALTGTTLADGSATAFLREVNGGKVRRVHKGETVNGMLVAEVKPDSVRLTQGGESEELTLHVASGPKTTIQPAQPATAGAGAQPPANAAAAAAAQQAAHPGGAQNAAQPPVAQNVAEVLAQRRRAARAAEAAAAQQQQQQQQQWPQQSATGQAQGGSQQSPPNWSSTYQRLMQQPRR
jgi:hypothetical protein